MKSIIDSKRAYNTKFWLNPEYLFDLKTIVGATLAVLVVRVCFSLFSLPASIYNPATLIEQSISVFPNQTSLGAWLQRIFIAPWMRWDSIHFWNIADHGYVASEGTPAFHPFYPMLVWFVSKFVMGNIVLALNLVSTIATIISIILITRYVEVFHDAHYSQLSGWLLLLSPISFVLLAPYTESTFMCLAIGMLWAVRHERWWLAGVLGACATLTRQQGLALALPMVWGIWVAWQQRRFSLQQIMAVSLIPISYIAYVVYRMISLSDFVPIAQANTFYEFIQQFLFSSTAHNIVAGQRVAWPWESIIGQINTMVHSVPPITYMVMIDPILGWAAVFVLVFGRHLLHIQELLYSLGITFLSLCYYNGDFSPYLALPRHMLLAFPLFIILATWLHNKRYLYVIISLMVITNIILLSLHILQQWIP